MNAQKLQSSVQCSGQAQRFVKDGHPQVNGDRNPDLCLPRVGARSVVMLDPQVTFDPAEEQLDPPPQPVNQGPRQRWDFERVGQKDQIPFRLGVEVTHLSQQCREGRPRFGQGGFSHRVAAHTRREIRRQRSLAGEAPVVFGSRDEERSGTGDPVQAFEIHGAAIQHGASPRLEDKFVEPANVVRAGVGDVNTGGNRTAQIDWGVPLDSGFGAAEVGPRKPCERKIEGRGVQRLDRVFQLQTEVFSGRERPGFAPEVFRQVLPQTPVALLVGLGQSRFGHRCAKAQVIKRLRFCVQTGSHVAPSLAPSQWRKSQADELLATAERPDPRPGIVAFHQTGKRLAIDQIQNLRKNVTAGIQGPKACAEPPQTSNA